MGGISFWAVARQAAAQPDDGKNQRLRPCSGGGAAAAAGDCVGGVLEALAFRYKILEAVEHQPSLVRHPPHLFPSTPCLPRSL